MAWILESENRIYLILASVGIAILVLVILCLGCVCCRRRSRTRAPKQPHRQALRSTERNLEEAQPVQLEEHVPSDDRQVEYGVDTRAEAQASSYYGGMADVSYFQPDSAEQCTEGEQEGVPSYAPRGGVQPKGTVRIDPAPRAPAIASSSNVDSPSHLSPPRRPTIALLSQMRYSDELHDSPIAMSPSHTTEEAPPPEYDPAWVNTDQPKRKDQSR